MKTRHLWILAIAAAMLLAAACGSSEPELGAPQRSDNTAAPASQTTSSSSAPKQWDEPPAMTIDTSKDIRAVIELEKGGEIVIDLFEKRAPTTVNNFVFLANEGYYNGVTFHRVLDGFMAQTGDPTGTGGGGPGYRFDNEFHPELRHSKPGILSMANAGVRNGMGTNGSQFFITFRDVHFLDGYEEGTDTAKNCTARGVSCHSVFGEVVDGMDTVMSIRLRDPSANPPPNFLGDAIKSVRIQEN